MTKSSVRFFFDSPNQLMNPFKLEESDPVDVLLALPPDLRRESCWRSCARVIIVVKILNKERQEGTKQWGLRTETPFSEGWPNSYRIPSKGNLGFLGPRPPAGHDGQHSGAGKPASPTRHRTCPPHRAGSGKSVGFHLYLKHLINYILFKVSLLFTGRLLNLRQLVVSACRRGHLPAPTVKVAGFVAEANRHNKVYLKVFLRIW